MSTQWDTEVLPVLEAVYAAVREHDAPIYGVAPKRINGVLGREAADASTAFALQRLVEAGYLRETLPSSDSSFGPSGVDLTEKSLQRLGGWPASAGDALISSLLAELDRRIATADPEERSALERFRDFAAGVGRDVLVAVLSSYADKTVRGD